MKNSKNKKVVLRSKATKATSPKKRTAPVFNKEKRKWMYVEVIDGCLYVWFSDTDFKSCKRVTINQCDHECRMDDYHIKFRLR